MNKYLIEFMYDGSDFVGWQEQPAGRTVQGELQEKLSTILRQEVKIVGAGRTDTGVHASMMAAHFELPEELSDKIAPAVFKLNRFLSPDVFVTKLRIVSPDFHARYSATSRSYGYYITLIPNPFLRKYHTFVPRKLDFEAMNRACQALIGQHDFSSFAKKHSDVTNHICTVSRAEWLQLSPSEWIFRITANRFLRSMVRALVGTLIEVGSDNITPEEFEDILERADIEYPFNTAPPTGLRLEAVQYPEELLGEVLFTP
ncbi:MAG: tRNA pseudouridine(38-40) synthase TruA [Bacteroidales bacterium]|uniref:tRNA pseudouridine(38-40) synthase TruA n=1 Tax=Porphyromonas sp. TaxID=1924944 RepID=UPI002974FBBC|nr:tRNA pseudouridine(38-40) synthase TruA [Porphyromonas sp.]MDD7438451.1 tRNA pseudouridine(38-40) synthase TruA [Bacteroidales bacterium]MDY3066894.1 tRNA pseudouridine(38-40) synthase TruA [Porphyromonas sp.]